MLGSKAVAIGGLLWKYVWIIVKYRPTTCYVYGFLLLYCSNLFYDEFYDFFNEFAIKHHIKDF